jgi:hypothetical protein
VRKRGLGLAVATAVVAPSAFGRGPSRVEISGQGRAEVAARQREAASNPSGASGSQRPDHWGIGVAFAGPAILLGPQAQYLGARAVAIEAGVFPGAPTLWAWGGVRVGPPLRWVRPFTGFWVTGGIAGESDCDEGAASKEDATACDSVGTFAAYAFRTGLDLQPPQRRLLVTLEVDFVRAAAENGILYFERDRWLTWGGVAFSRRW